MKKNLLFIVAAMIVATNLTFGQSHHELPIYRYFNAVAPDSLNALDSTDITFDGWSVQTVVGATNKSWWVNTYSGSTNYYAECNGYQTTMEAEEQWLISPGFSTIDYPNATLKFSSCQKYDGAPIEILVSTNYDGLGLPATATWSALAPTLPPLNLSGPRVWVNSGNVSLSSYSGANVYVAFKYTSTATIATQWEVDSISILNTGVGVQEAAVSNQIVSIYPNPVSTMLYFNNIDGIKTIQIFNILGEAVERTNVSGNNTIINVSDLSKGIYFISMINSDGIISTKKFSKE
jgi:hypothetical protein